MPRGGARPNAGAKKGSKHRYQRELDIKLKENGRLDPLDVMLAMAADTELAPEIRIRAATGAAPYVHRRKPQAMEITGKFEFLSPEEREMRRSVILEEIRMRRAKEAGGANTN